MLLMKNQWFAGLPSALRFGWKNNLSMVELKRGDSLLPDKRGGTVFFPINCVAKISRKSDDGFNIFLRFSGPNFFIGLTDLISVEGLDFEAEVCGDGYAFSLPVSTVRDCLPPPDKFSAFQLKALSQIAERAFFDTRCLGMHTGVHRLARVLLEAADAFGEGRAITITQQELSEILMLRRETVSQLLNEWTGQGLVSLRRGCVTIENKSELVTHACSCYPVIKQFERAELAGWCEIPWVLPSISKYA